MTPLESLKFVSNMLDTAYVSPSLTTFVLQLDANDFEDLKKDLESHVFGKKKPIPTKEQAKEIFENSFPGVTLDAKDITVLDEPVGGINGNQISVHFMGYSYTIDKTKETCPLWALVLRTGKGIPFNYSKWE